MKGTAAGIRITRQIMRNANVSHLRMHQAMQNPTVDNRASADPCSHREVERIREVLCRAPARLPKSRCINIGIKTDWHRKGVPHSSRKIVVLPTRLGCGGHIAECERGAVQ